MRAAARRVPAAAAGSAALLRQFAASLAPAAAPAGRASPPLGLLHLPATGAGGVPRLHVALLRTSARACDDGPSRVPPPLHAGDGGVPSSGAGETHAADVDGGGEQLGRHHNHHSPHSSHHHDHAQPHALRQAHAPAGGGGGGSSWRGGSGAYSARLGSLGMYAELCKARLSSLVVMTTGAGFLMAGAPASWTALAAATVGTSLAAGAAGTFNQVWETTNDTAMKRTQRRPLPSGRISRGDALAFGGGLTAASAGLLWAGTNPLTAYLGLANIVLYALVYTPLKTRSELNTAVGALVGAIPPVMGWVAAGGALTDAEPLLLAAALFWWQFPHFYSLAWTHRRDYARGGFAMVPVNDADGGKRTAWYALRSSVALATLPFAAAGLGVASPMFAVEGALLNGYLLTLAWRFYAAPSDATARPLFRTSLWYLPLLLGLLVFHSEHWARAEDADVAAVLGGGGGAAAAAEAEAAAADEDHHHRGHAAHHAGHNHHSVPGHDPATLPGSSRALEALVATARDAGRAVCLHETVIKDAGSGGGGGAASGAAAAVVAHAAAPAAVVMKALCPVPAVHTSASDAATGGGTSTSGVSAGSSGGGGAAAAPQCPVTALGAAVSAASTVAPVVAAAAPAR